MGAWARRLAACFLLLLAFELCAPAWAKIVEEEHGPAVQTGDDAEDAESHTDEEWEELKKNIMDSLPDDEEDENGESHDEEDQHLDDRHARWHITDGYPFVEYNGFLEDDASKSSAVQNIHEGKMTLTEAKDWCAKNEKCVGFHHAGEPGEGPYEIYFKDYWKLNIDTEEQWSSYYKGEKLSEEEVTIDHAEPVSVTSEEVMAEYGIKENDEL